MAATQWKGTNEERDVLNQALHRNCLCEYDNDGVRTTTCAGHAALIGDQRFLDGLLAMRYAAAKLKTEEGIEK